MFDATSVPEGFELGRVWSVLERRRVPFVIEFAYDMDDNPKNSPKVNTDVRLKIPLTSFVQMKQTKSKKKTTKKPKKRGK